ncbi:MAG TPA: acylphosphatase [Baekduia sp.]|nr:acylphosphatase [Baekduia sp.]
MAGRIARDVVVHGRVQGVFFRAFVQEVAQRHGVAGWARNQPAGTVEVRLEGEPRAVAAVEQACGEGPPRARVERIEARDVAAEGLDHFSVG